MSDETPWIEWNGGECPVDDACVVFIKQRNGMQRGPGEAGFWRARFNRPDLWGRERSWRKTDIIAYRVVSA